MRRSSYTVLYDSRYSWHCWPQQGAWALAPVQKELVHKDELNAVQTSQRLAIFILPSFTGC
jgi:hypothetical protein